MIADTNFILDALEGESGAAKKATELKGRNEAVIITSVTVFELWQGLEDIKSPIKLGSIAKFLAQSSQLNLDFEAAKLAGSIHALLERAGLRIQPEDSMIAGIALHHQQTLLTRNIKHFSRVKGLKVETY